eukprot:TRINITY_DN12727_c0_g1_i1.p1 TRINITY_DN12727_c0_g1~~TRINITY_DN12727_c0_g1_i1.p1  ORF type:complete len:359 (+),score=83.43 TRINITY_DN12727_c0_g1_i1:42-1118(+)
MTSFLEDDSVNEPGESDAQHWLLSENSPPAQSDERMQQETDHAGGASRRLVEIKIKGLKPDVGTYNAFIRACGKARRADLALHAFHEMEQKGLQPDPSTYNRLIRAFGDVQDAQKALEIFEEMKQRYFEPSMSTYRVVAKACMDGNMAEKAWEVFEEMLRRGLYPQWMTNHDLENACIGMREEHVFPVWGTSPSESSEWEAHCNRWQYEVTTTKLHSDARPWKPHDTEGYLQDYPWVPNPYSDFSAGEAHDPFDYGMAWDPGMLTQDLWNQHEKNAWSIDLGVDDRSTASSNNGKHEDGASSVSDSVAEGSKPKTVEASSDNDSGQGRARRSRNKISNDTARVRKAPSDGITSLMSLQ